MRSFQGFSAPRSRLVCLIYKPQKDEEFIGAGIYSLAIVQKTISAMKSCDTGVRMNTSGLLLRMKAKKQNKQSWELHRNLVQTWLFSEAVLQTFGQCPLTWGHNRPKGLFWHHTQDMEHIYSQSKTKDFILKWITVQTDTPRQPPGFNSRHRQNTAQSLQTRELRATITSW